MIEPALHAVVADHVFDGTAVHERAAVVIARHSHRASCAAGGRAADDLRPGLA